MSIAENCITAAMVAPDAGQIQCAKVKMEEALREKRAEAAKIAQVWQAARISDMQTRHQTPSTTLAETLRVAVAHQELCGDFELHVIPRGQKAARILRVSEILSDPETYDECLTLDPLEPEYDGHRIVGKLFLDGVPQLHSMARGGSSYRLFAELEDAGLSPIQLIWSEDTSATIVSRCVAQLKDSGRFFAAGDAPCRIHNGKMELLSEPLLDFELSRLIQFKKRGRGGDLKPASMQPRLVKQIQALACSQLPRIEAIVDYPQPRPNNELIDQLGYDAATGLFLTQDPALFSVHDAPDPEQIARAVETCLVPFAHYRLASAHQGRSAILAAVMTAVLRPVLPVAPLIGISSPSLGAGKSFLAMALGVLATGEMPGTHNIPKNDTELQKVLFSHLLNGSRVIIFDNADMVLHSDELSSFVTSPQVVGRILGVSSISKRLPNRAFLIVNGRNLSFGDGLSRRHVLVRLASVEPDALVRKFDFMPHEMALKMRKEIITAVLTLTRINITDCVRHRSFASFDRWSMLVRNPIAQLARSHPALNLTDPLSFLVSGLRNDAQTESRGELFAFINDRLQVNHEFTSSDLRESFLGDRAWEDLVRSVFPNTSYATPHGIGMLLSQLADQPANGFMLRSRKRDGRRRWRIERHEPSSFSS